METSAIVNHKYCGWRNDKAKHTQVMEHAVALKLYLMICVSLPYLHVYYTAISMLSHEP